MQNQHFDADAYLTAALTAAELTIDPAWRAEVVEHLRVAARMRAALDEVSLNDNKFELAAVFAVTDDR